MQRPSGGEFELEQELVQVLCWLSLKSQFPRIKIADGNLRIPVASEPSQSPSRSYQGANSLVLTDEFRAGGEGGDSNPQLSGNFALQGICYYRLYYRELSEFTSEAPRSPAKLQEAQKM